MAQWWTGFADDSLGSAPSGWTSRWGAAGSAEVVAPPPGGGAAAGARAVILRLSANQRWALSWDAPGVITGDVEVAALLWHAAGSTGASRRRVHLHGGGALGSESSYFSEETSTSSVRRYVAGSTAIAGTAPAPLLAGWVWVRLRRTGTSLRMRAWPADAAEPSTWDVDAVDASLSSGWVGVGTYAATPTDADAVIVAAVGVGTAGDEAPLTALTGTVPDVPDLATPPEAVLTGHRVEDWSVELLDVDGGSRGLLQGVRGGGVDVDRGRVVQGSARLVVDRVEGQDVAWSRDRVRVWWHVNSYRWPLLTGLPAAPSATWTRVRRPDGEEVDVPTWDVEVLDTVSVLAEDVLVEALSVPAGSVATSAASAQVTAAGEVAAITPSPETLITGLTWPAGTTRLRVVNDLLAAVNYSSIRADPYGALVSEPYRAPASRPIARRHAPGPRAIHLGRVAREHDIFRAPNRVVLITAGSDTTEALVAVADNADPGDPLSIPVRGRVVALVEEGVDATSLVVLQEMADRRLAEVAAGGAATMTVQHLVVPQALGDLVVVALDELDRAAVVTGWAVTLGSGSLMSTSLLEVRT